MTTIAEQMAADAGPAPAAAPLTISQQMAQDASSAPSPAPTSAPKATTAKASSFTPEMRNGKPLTGPDALDNGAGAVANIVTGVGASIYGGLKGLVVAGKGLVTGDGFDKSLSAGADAVTQAQNDYTFQPRTQVDQDIVKGWNSGYNPLNWLPMGGKAVGGALSDAGHPLLATAAETAGAAIPMAFGLKGTRTAATEAGSSLADIMKPSAPAAARVEPTLEPTAGASPLASNPTPTLSQVAPGVPAASNLTLAPAEAVPGKSAPFAAAATPAPKPTFSDPTNNVFAESAPDAKGGLPAADQAQRAAVLSEIGLDSVRRSAITGDANQAAVDFQTSRLKGSPAGDAMSQQLASEKQAISDYADGIAQRTGGSALNDQSAKLARGNTILTPLEGLKEWFDNQTSALYKTADERAQGVPTQLDNFRSVLGDDSLATNSDRVNLRTAAGAYAQKLGIIDGDGNVFANAQQAETMRKYLNENWSPQNSGLVGKLKDALDTDVMSAAGEDVYGQARALRAQRAATLDNPSGMAKLLDSSGPQGVNRAVPVEKVADSLTNMPVAQLGNIVGTLKNMPPELQPMAADALAEIKAQYAHNVKDIGGSQAGQWNAKGVQKYLSNNSARMATVFDPDEMKSFGTLNDAGNILAKDQSYPGAFAQQQNLMRAGVAHAITSGATAAGGMVAGPLGSVAGAVLGGKMAGKFNDASTLRATQKRMVSLKGLMSGDEP